MGLCSLVSITHQVLGRPGEDNALWVEIDSGQSVERLLFDCGEGCLSARSLGEVQSLNALFFSHLHMDHVAGFDSFFRATFDRTSRPNHIWGPPGSSQILQRRFQGFLWNLHAEMTGTWQVSDVHEDRICTSRFELSEAFEIRHEAGTEPRGPLLWEGQGATVEALTMDHRTPTLAYIVREKARQNIDLSRLADLGLKPGPWMKELKNPAADPTSHVTIHGQPHRLADLRDRLLVSTPGDSIAYLTDFLLDEAAMTRLVPALHGCQTVICEAQYRHADLELALKNHHMTTQLAATLAKQAGVGKLVLFHLSERYQTEGWAEMREEARAIFPNTHFPPEWAD